MLLHILWRFTLSRTLGFTPNFGIILLPLLIGIVVLFFNTHSIPEWLLIIVGILIMIMGLAIRFMPVSLLGGIFMFGKNH